MLAHVNQTNFWPPIMSKLIFSLALNSRVNQLSGQFAGRIVALVPQKTQLNYRCRFTSGLGGGSDASGKHKAGFEANNRKRHYCTQTLAIWPPVCVSQTELEFFRLFSQNHFWLSSEFSSSLLFSALTLWSHPAGSHVLVLKIFKQY